MRYRLAGESCGATSCVVADSGALTTFFFEAGVVKIRVEVQDTE